MFPIQSCQACFINWLSLEPCSEKCKMCILTVISVVQLFWKILQITYLCVCVAWYTLYVQGYEEFCSKETCLTMFISLFFKQFFFLNQFIIKSVQTVLFQSLESLLASCLLKVAGKTSRSRLVLGPVTVFLALCDSDDIFMARLILRLYQQTERDGHSSYQNSFETAD